MMVSDGVAEVVHNVVVANVVLFMRSRLFATGRVRATVDRYCVSITFDFGGAFKLLDDGPRHQ